MIPAISIAEKIIAIIMVLQYMEDNNLINDNQFGFRKYRSTELAAVLKK